MSRRLAERRCTWEAFSYYEGTECDFFSTLFKVAQVALVYARGCPETNAPIGECLPTLYDGADAGVKIVSTRRAVFCLFSTVKRAESRPGATVEN